MFFQIFFLAISAGLCVQAYPSAGVGEAQLSPKQDLEVDGEFSKVVDKFGHATRDATDAVKGGISTVIGAGQGVLETGQHFGSEVENVNNGVQKVLGKLGDAVKHSTDVVKEGVYTVLNFGKRQNEADNMNGGIGNVINEIGHVAKDGTDAVKEGLNTVVNVGNGVLRTGEKLGEEVKNVNQGVQGIFDKIGDAAKHTTDALQEGIFAVLGMGKGILGADKKSSNSEGKEGLAGIVSDITKKSTDAIRGGISTLFNIGSGIFNFGNNKKISETPRAENPNPIQDAESLASNARVSRRSTPEQGGKNKFDLWREIAGDTMETIGNTAGAVKEGIISVVDAGKKVAKAGIDIQNAQLTVQSTLPRIGWKFVNSIINPKEEN